MSNLGAGGHDMPLSIPVPIGQINLKGMCAIVSELNKLIKMCKLYGFVTSKKQMLSRYIGDGILQQIYYGHNDRISVGITSMYARLPDVFWDSMVPFTTYTPQHLHDRPAPRFSSDFSKQSDIELLLNGGLDALDKIIDQQALIFFAAHVDSIENSSLHSFSERLWGAYIICRQYKTLMYAVCYEYTNRSEGFRRNKTNQEMLVNGQLSDYAKKRTEFDERLSVLSELWHALFLDDYHKLESFARVNFSENTNRLKMLNVPHVSKQE